MAFNPNQISLEDGIKIIKQAQEELGLSQDRIFTSIDAEKAGASKMLATNTVPSGFSKWMLPFYTDGAATFYISSAAPNSTVPRHSHEEGAGIRFIMNGSLEYNGQVLSEGDWMYMPANAPYEFTVGARGVSMFYCYQCCCQQAEL